MPITEQLLYQIQQKRLSMWQLEAQLFCLPLYLTGVHFRGKLQQGGHVGEQKIKCHPIRTWEIGGLWLQDKLYEKQPLEGSIKKAVLKTFAIFTGKHMCRSLFFHFINKRFQKKLRRSVEYVVLSHLRIYDT